jgi:hypothetical protein
LGNCAPIFGFGTQLSLDSTIAAGNLTGRALNYHDQDAARLLSKGIIMIKRWVTAFAMLVGLVATAGENLLQAQPPAPVPAWIPPPAPAPPMTLWRFLGIPQGFQRIGDARLNRSGNFPGLERKPPLKPIAHPDNLLSNNPAIKKAAEIKMQEDLAKQKIKALKYLAKLGCDKCYGGVKEAMMAALDDCTEQVRYEAAKALGEAAVQHCDICSRQCCCDEDLTKKLAQIVYEMDDKGCPLEPSERVREMAREALEACCPNVGPPLIPEDVVVPPGPETPPVPDPETPPAPGPETPPSVPPELPPPPGRNGVEPTAPRALIPPPPGRNGVTPRLNGEVTPQPTLPPDMSMRQFLRSRADRMAATSQVRRAPVVRRAAGPNVRVPMHAVQPLVEVPRVQEPIAEAPAARLVVSDEMAVEAVTDSANSGATVTLSDTAEIPSLTQRESSENSLRIRISDPEQSERRAAAAPAVVPLTLSATKLSSSSEEGTVVRIRDGDEDLQLASAEDEPVAETKTISVVSSRRSQVIVSDLFAPPSTVATQPSSQPLRHTAAHEPSPEIVTSVQPSPPAKTAKPRGAAVKAHGHVSNVDSRAGTVRFRVNGGEAPAAGTLVKVYHQFLLGQECVGALEVIDVQKGIATARPVGNVSLAKLSPGDHVAY